MTGAEAREQSAGWQDSRLAGEGDESGRGEQEQLVEEEQAAVVKLGAGRSTVG